MGWDPVFSDAHAHRSERETAVRISQEIGNLMKEIETLVEEKTKESLDVSRLTREGEPGASGRPAVWRAARQVSPRSPGGGSHGFAQPTIYQLPLVQ